MTDQKQITLTLEFEVQFTTEPANQVEPKLAQATTNLFSAIQRITGAKQETLDTKQGPVYLMQKMLRSTDVARTDLHTLIPIAKFETCADTLCSFSHPNTPHLEQYYVVSGREGNTFEGYIEVAFETSPQTTSLSFEFLEGGDSINYQFNRYDVKAYQGPPDNQTPLDVIIGAEMSFVIQLMD